MTVILDAPGSFGHLPATPGAFPDPPLGAALTLDAIRRGPQLGERDGTSYLGLSLLSSSSSSSLPVARPECAALRADRRSVLVCSLYVHAHTGGHLSAENFPASCELISSSSSFFSFFAVMTPTGSPFSFSFFYLWRAGAGGCVIAHPPLVPSEWAFSASV